MILKQTKFLVFTLLHDSGKTYTVGVANFSGVELGMIKWVGAWRTYCFLPACETLFDSKCIADIQTFIQDLLAERKNSRAKSAGK